MYSFACLFRCDDANLVEIPVEVETPDHHYYHVWFMVVLLFLFSLKYFDPY